MKQSLCILKLVESGWANLIKFSEKLSIEDPYLVYFEKVGAYDGTFNFQIEYYIAQVNHLL